jgi:hypothetical protein
MGDIFRKYNKLPTCTKCLSSFQLQCVSNNIKDEGYFEKMFISGTNK